MDLKYIVIVLAQILVILGIIYLVGFALSIPTVVENFKVEGSKERNISPQKMATLFEEINENTKDSLNISKHRAAYQDALAQIQESSSRERCANVSKIQRTCDSSVSCQRCLMKRSARFTSGELLSP